MNAALNGLLVVHWLSAADAAAEAAGADDCAAEAAADAAGAAEAGAADGAGVDAEPHAARSTVTNPTTNANRALRLAPFTGKPPRLPIFTNVPSALLRNTPASGGHERSRAGPHWDRPSARRRQRSSCSTGSRSRSRLAIRRPLSSARSQSPAEGRWSCDRGRACRAQRDLSRGACAPQG